MELLCPAGICIHLAEFNQHGAFELAYFSFGECCASINFFEDGVQFGGSKVIGIKFLHSVIAQATAMLFEEFVTDEQSLNNIVKAFDFCVAHFGQLIDIFAVCGGVFHGHGCIGTPCRQHLDLESAFTYLFVIFERVNRIVSGADRLHIVTQHQVFGSEFGTLQFLVTLVVNLPGGIRVKYLVYSETGFKLQMSPVVQRVAHAIGHGFGPFQEFIPVRCVAGYIFLGHAVGTQDTPFVVVASQP
ncbi:MAG: hypothetical protein BWY95_02608 [Bacteroidetes bacterium ADurb.BinA104]|nr:MAG: hypothetical protein BWY95_02608 [Bacteroidetes bacterium ADurb.BinA104]